MTTAANRGGRPAVGPEVFVRFPEALLTEIDEYAEASDISRAEAIRRLTALGLDHAGWGPA